MYGKVFIQALLVLLPPAGAQHFVAFIMEFWVGPWATGSTITGCQHMHGVNWFLHLIAPVKGTK